MQWQFIPYVFPHLNRISLAFLISCPAFVPGFLLSWLSGIVPLARAAVIERIREAVIVQDANDRVVDLNPAARSLANCRASKAIGRPFAEVFFIWPELVEHCRNRVEADEEIRMGEGEALRSFDLRISPLSRRNRFLNFSGRLIVLHDITGRIQVERALKESEGRFRSIFAEVPIGMAVVDPEGHLLQVNRAFCEMLGYRERELVGRSLLAITHPHDAGKDMLLAEQALKGEMSSYQVEKRYLKKNHETLWCDLTATILRNQHG